MPAPTAASGATGSRSCTLLAAKPELLVDRARGREQRAHQEGLARAGITTTALQFSSFAKMPEERRAKILRAIQRLASL